MFFALIFFGLWPLAFGHWPVVNTTETTSIAPDQVFEDLLNQDSIAPDQNFEDLVNQDRLETWLQIARFLKRFETRLVFKRRIVDRNIRLMKDSGNKSEHQKWVRLERGLKKLTSKLSSKRGIVARKIRQMQDGRK